MSFEEFQENARLYVLGALEPWEMKEFEQAARKFGRKGENFVRECYALHEALALRLRPVTSTALLKERLMSIVRRHKRG